MAPRAGLDGRVARSIAALFAMVAAAAAPVANGTEISILDAEHSVSYVIEHKGYPYGPDGDPTQMSWSQAITSDSPVSLSADVTREIYGNVFDGLGWQPEYSASATSDLFSVATSTAHRSADGGRAQATAETILSFSVLQDFVAPLTLQLGVLGQPYTDGAVSLWDTTFNQVVFSYAWTTQTLDDLIPWTSAGRQAIIALTPALLASHTYDLTMSVTTYARMDNQSAYIGVSGLVPVAAPVPEPETYALALFGLLGTFGLARRRRRARDIINEANL